MSRNPKSGDEQPKTKNQKPMLIGDSGIREFGYSGIRVDERLKIDKRFFINNQPDPHRLVIIHKIFNKCINQGNFL
jgi:hypothetical protein